MKFTLEFPVNVVDPPGEFQSMPAIREMAEALEQAGIDACYVTDHPAPDSNWLKAAFGHDALDPFAGLAFVAAASSKLLLHTNIVVLPYRNPFVTAKAAATVHVLSGGRLILGVGIGYQKVEFEALGSDFHRRGKLTDEALAAIRAAWTGGGVEISGSGFRAQGVEPRPAPNPPPPIWIGGGSEKALDRAAQWGDGWCPFYAAPGMNKINQDAGIQSIEHLREQIARLQEKRAALGKTAPFDIALGPRMRIKRADAASAQRFLDEIGPLQEAGVSWATVEMIHPSRAEYIELVHWFGEEVVAKTR
ncbi:MAG: TIGR03619 family F420-dependent LLM class oxidoreductase [Novosphingobium sp.]|nr:TIGR03619 family F420-dependent LLM class oxidoreductase [Novosphingobium sp.]MCP5403981.1 TIGR03619 family F420-dependent LLM class oxidoreductase [Novosphingobium sp.]